jgi:hypothetical protein
MMPPAYRGAGPEHMKALRWREERRGEDSPDKVHRRRKVMEFEFNKAPPRMMEGEHRPRLYLQMVPRSNRSGKRQRPVVTGNQQMLAIIDDVSRGGVGK